MIAPDFAPDRFAGWHMLNTVLQRRSGIHLHLLTPVDATDQTHVIAADQVDVVYANPFDAADMVRNRGFIPFARPAQRSDEMVIATGAGSAIQTLADLKPGHRVAVTHNKDVKLIGLRLLEPVDLEESMLQWVDVESFQAGARRAIKGEVDAAFFLADAFASLSKLTRSQMRVLVESRISDISHVVLAHPRMAADLPRLSEALLSFGKEPRDNEVLAALGLPHGFEPMTQEDAEFMIDLMDTLLD